MFEDATEDPPRPQRYALVQETGELTFGTADFREIRGKIATGGQGETGLDWFDAHYPLGYFYYVPFGDDPRRMNKVGNGMYWELAAPRMDPDGDDEPHDPRDRVIKARGPVAFISNSQEGGLSAEQEAMVRAAHERATSKLRARGWL